MDRTELILQVFSIVLKLDKLPQVEIARCNINYLEFIHQVTHWINNHQVVYNVVLVKIRIDRHVIRKRITALRNDLGG